MDAMIKVGNLVKTKENTLRVPKGTLGIVIAVHEGPLPRPTMGIPWSEGNFCEVRFFGHVRFQTLRAGTTGRYSCDPDYCILEVVL